MAKNEKKKLESAYDEAHEQDEAEAAPSAAELSLAPANESPKADLPKDAPAAPLAPVAPATDGDAKHYSEGELQNGEAIKVAHEGHPHGIDGSKAESQAKRAYLGSSPSGFQKG
jgi:hypothetical protein